MGYQTVGFSSPQLALRDRMTLIFDLLTSKLPLFTHYLKTTSTKVALCRLFVVELD